MKTQKQHKRLAGLRGRFGITISAFIVLVVILNIFQFFAMDNIYTYSTKLEMTEAFEQIRLLDITDKDFNKSIAEIEGAYNIYVELYHPRDVLVYTTNTNKWIYESDINSESSENSVLKPRIMKVLEHRDTPDGCYFEIRQEFYASAKYIVFGDFTSLDYGIEIYSSEDIIAANSRTASWAIFGISILLFLIIFTATMIYTRAFIIPLDKINDVTKKITQMDFSETCPRFRIRELDELSTSVNALSASLDLTLKDLQIKNSRLEQEVEKDRQLIEMRKAFIANASHELKTPIAIIQGYAEGLKLGITDDSPEEYCDTIIEETQKMNSLVMRLLEITKYDFSKNYLHCEPFVIADTLGAFLHLRRKIIEEKGITVEFNIDPAFIGYGDKELIENIFGNYISNAISHADFEKKIIVTCQIVADSYRVSVFNTGKQIAPEDIDNIWQSFYRADKSHSRAQGRFGLGLSIVASAQQTLGREYGVLNRENGVEFWFDIARYEKH